MDNDPTKNIMKPLRQLIWLLNAALILYIFSGTERHLLKDFFCSRVLRLSDLPRCWEKPQTAICCYPSFLVCLFLFSSLNARLYMLALSAISLLIVPVWSNGLCRMDFVWFVIRRNVKKLFFARKVLFRILRKLITFRNARSRPF